MLLYLGLVSVGLEYACVCTVSIKMGLICASLFRLGVFWSGICLCWYCFFETDERMAKVNQTYFFLPVWHPSPVCCILACLPVVAAGLSVHKYSYMA